MNELMDPRNHLPYYYKGIREIDILSEAIIAVLLHVEKEIHKILNNNFLQTCDQEGIVRFEKLIGIQSDRSIDLETRKQKVLTKMLASSSFTVRVLENSLKDICDNGNFKLHYDYDNFILSLEVNIGRQGMLDLLYNLLYTMLPAHIEFKIINKVSINENIDNYSAGSFSTKKSIVFKEE